MRLYANQHFLPSPRPLRALCASAVSSNAKPPRARRRATRRDQIAPIHYPIFTTPPPPPPHHVIFPNEPKKPRQSPLHPPSHPSSTPRSPPPHVSCIHVSPYFQASFF